MVGLRACLEMKMKFLFVAASALALMFAACGKKDAAVSAPATMSVDSLMSVAGSLSGDTVEVEGLCLHLCKHGGTKAFLAGADSTVILRCQATAAMGGAFAPDCVGKMLTVKGVVAEVEIAAPDSAACAADSVGHECETSGKAVKAYYLEALSYNK